MNRRLRFAKLRTLTFLTLLALLPHMAGAQSIVVSNVDASAFPTIDADLMIFGNDGNPFYDLHPTDVTVTENGAPVAQVFSVNCAAPLAPYPISAVLVCDRSGSMDGPKLDMLKYGAAKFVEAVRFEQQTAVAVTGFNDAAVVVTDFTNNVQRLLSGINSLTADGTTEFDPAFLDPVSGGIPLLAARSPAMPRVLIFLTDGSPNVAPSIANIIADAVRDSIKIFTITLGAPMTPALEAIAAQTGGAAYGDVQDGSQLASIYAMIAIRSQKVQPCHIRWKSNPGCNLGSSYRSAVVTFVPWSVHAGVTYRAPLSSVVSVTVTPNYLWFGAAVAAGTERKVTLNVVNGEVSIVTADILPAQPFTVSDWGGPPPPFTLKRSESRTITVRYDAPDSSSHQSNFTLHATPCEIPPILLAGGKWDPRIRPALRLVTPRGGEIFDGCDSFLITWTGVPVDAAVRIEYRAHETDPWQLVADNVRGLSYRWRVPAPGRTYRVRISLAGEEMVDTIRTFAGGGNQPPDNNIQALDAMLNAPSGVAMNSSYLFFTEPGLNVVRLVNLRTGYLSTVAGTGVPGYSGDSGQAVGAQLKEPTSLAILGNTLYIADKGNHAIRRVNITTGIITTIAGTGLAGLGDDGPARTMMLHSPTHLCAAAGRLFVSDSGNRRILMIDPATGKATAVWVDGTTGALAVATTPTGGFDSLFFVRLPSHEIWALDQQLSSARRLFNSQPALLPQPSGLVVQGQRLFVADDRLHSVTAIDRPTRKLEQIVNILGRSGYQGDAGPATEALTTLPGAMAADSLRLFLCDAGNGRIRVVQFGAANRMDSSRSTFAATTGHLAFSVRGRRLDFGSMGLGAWADSIMKEALCNDGELVFPLDSIMITGPNAADFQLVSSTTIPAIEPSTCRTIEISFHPGGLGPRSAIAIAYGHCAGIDTLQLRGLGTTPCEFQAEDIIDVGAVPVGAGHDSLLVKTLCNTGTAELRGRPSLAPADGAFAIVGGGGDFTLASGECLKVAIRFTPGVRGRSAAVLDYGLPAACGRAHTTLVGTGLAPGEVTAALRAEFAPRPCGPWPYDTTVVLSNTGDFPLTVTGLELRNNAEGFSIIGPNPTPGAPLVIVPDSSASVTIRANPATIGAKSATLRIISSDPAGPADVALAARRDTTGLAVAPMTLSFTGASNTGPFPLDSIIVLRNTGTSTVMILGALLRSGDVGRFSLVPHALPDTLLPGGADTFHIRALGPTATATFETSLHLEIEGICDSSHRDMTIIEPGTQPAIAVIAPAFRTLRCPGDDARDTTLEIRNNGGGPLTITGLKLGGANPGAFALAAAPPIAIPPGDALSIPVRFAPPGFGSFNATLTVTSDAVTGDSVIALAAQRVKLGLTALPARIDMGAIVSGGNAARDAVLANTGTTALLLALSLNSGAFAVTPTAPGVLLAGDSLRLRASFTAPAAGTFDDTLVISDLDCGVLARIPLHGVVVSASTLAVLPRDTVTAGARVALPLRITIPDRSALTASAATSFRAAIDFSGLLLDVDSAAGATITANSFDTATGMQHLTLEGRVPAGAEGLVLLHGGVPSNNSGETALRFTTFAWDVAAVRADTINGALVVLPGCSPGFRITAHIVGLKLRPNPLRGEGTVEFELDEEETTRMAVRDALGRTVASVDAGRLLPGVHQLPFRTDGLPSGLYTLTIETLFGAAAVPVVVVR